MSLAVRYSACVAAVALVAGFAAPARADEKPAEGRPIDLVICLDVSGSMNGLVDSAKIKLWEVVNEMARLRPMPNLRVGLYSYGHTSYPADTGWVRKEIGPIATPDHLQWAPGLPKTRSGKIMRRILRKIAAGDTADLGDVTTLADPSVVEKLVEAAKA